MAYVKIDNGLVVQRQPIAEDGFILAPDDVYVGHMYDGSTFSPPPSQYHYVNSGAWSFDASECKSQKEVLISKNVDKCLKAIAAQYPEGERETWHMQSYEAEQWTADNTYVPDMLNAMVSSSNGGWTLSTLVTHIMNNVGEFKAAAGDILGQKKALMGSLQTVYDGLGTTHTDQDLMDFDCSVTMPVINLEDKF